MMARSNKQKPLISVVILNWNGRDVLRECLDSVRAIRYVLHEVIVVDNGSKDDSVKMVIKDYPDVVLIENAYNLGASGGRNVGLLRAMDSNVYFIFTLDNDLVADPNVISGLLKAFDENPGIGLAQAKVYDFDEPNLILGFGSKIDYTQNIVKNYFVRDTGQYEKVLEVDFVGTGATLVRKEVYDEVGLLDPMFLGYGYEDIDLCVRARQFGYKVVWCPYAKVWHRPHSGVGKYSFRKKYLESRNAIYFMKKHALWHQWMKFLFFAGLGLVYAFFRESLRGNLKGVIGKAGGLFDGLRGHEQYAIELISSGQVTRKASQVD